MQNEGSSCLSFLSSSSPLISLFSSSRTISLTRARRSEEVFYGQKK